MPLFEFEGKRPQIHETAFVADTASIIGDVTIEENASVWYGVVLRADYGPLVVRAGANVHDGSVLHGPPGQVLEVGPGATVALLSGVHLAILGEEPLVRNGATAVDRPPSGAARA